MAAIVIGASAWEIFNHNLFNGWADLPLQTFRLTCPLVLLWLIWRGRPWARYLLVGYCCIIICVNLPAAAHFQEMVARRHFGNVILLLFLTVGYAVVGAVVFFSTAISSLMNYRYDERDLA